MLQDKQTGYQFPSNTAIYLVTLILMGHAAGGAVG
jgi:hypothetical protein